MYTAREASKSRTETAGWPSLYQRSNTAQRKSPYCSAPTEKSASRPVCGSRSTQGMNCR